MYIEREMTYLGFDGHITIKEKSKNYMFFTCTGTLCITRNYSNS